jgi:hypothetical protein
MTTQLVNSDTFINQLKKSYQADHQVKYLSLQAELDLLLHQIQKEKTMSPKSL